jgi:hypothetical protein
MEHHISCNGHSISQVSINLVQDIFRRASQENSACFRVFALGNEGKVFVADFLNLKESASSYIRFGEIVNSVDDCCAGGAGNSVVVCLSNSAESSYVGFQEVMLCEIL